MQAFVEARILTLWLNCYHDDDPWRIAVNPARRPAD